MADIVLIPCPGLGTLAMTCDEFNSALAAGRQLGSSNPPPVPCAPNASDELVDAQQLEQRTGVPATWWMAQARQQRIPFRKIGRRVRFDPNEVLTETGGPQNPSNLIQRGVYPALRSAGLRKVTFHGLRHTYATLQLSRGENLGPVSKQLGHANVAITQSTYRHVLPSEGAGMADRLHAALKEVAAESKYGNLVVIASQDKKGAG